MFAYLTSRACAGYHIVFSYILMFLNYFNMCLTLVGLYVGNSKETECILLVLSVLMSIFSLEYGGQPWPIALLTQSLSSEANALYLLYYHILSTMEIFKLKSLDTEWPNLPPKITIKET